MIFNSMIVKKKKDRILSSKDINFYDYDGTLVYSYTLAEAQALTALPDGPAHDGLVFQGWNWSLEKVKALARPMNVGPMYITDDGKTRLKIRVWDKVRSNVPLHISQTVSNGVTIDWGDGSAPETLNGTGNVNTSHQYAEAGDYTIALSVADGCTLGLGNGTYVCSVLGRNRGSGIVYCNLLQEVYIGHGITGIGLGAFYNCFSLASVTIPESVTAIGDSAFGYCYALLSVTVPESVTAIGSGAFVSTTSLRMASIPESVTVIGDNAFGYCYALLSVTVPESVTAIGNRVFYADYSLSSISIPESVTRIGEYAFRYCNNLTSVAVPNGVTSIGIGGFDSCRALASITIPEGVTAIVNSAFSGCESLVSVLIPESVASIGDSAFKNCYGVGEYYLKPTTPPTLANVNAFEGIPSDCIIYVPAGSLEAYKTAENWSAYASYMREEAS